MEIQACQFENYKKYLLIYVTRYEMSLDFKILIGNSARLVLIQFDCDNRVIRLMLGEMIYKYLAELWQ
jgi:hypothetical protein